MNIITAMADTFNIDKKALREEVIDQFGYDYNDEDVQIVAEEMAR